jgi:hypothetical protein
MSGKENCFDNALVDTFFKTLKAELAWRTIFQSRIEAASAIGRYIDSFYNPVRRHSASTSSARFSSKGGQRKIENALHFPKASPCAPCPILTSRTRFGNPLMPSFRTVCLIYARPG